jgi:hypothetical protein
MQGVVKFFKRLFGGKADTPPPLLVRLRSRSGVIEGQVEIRATWSPGGKTTTWTTVPAQGLCIVPWRHGSKVDLVIAHPRGGVGQLAIRAEDVTWRAAELWLANDG